MGRRTGVEDKAARPFADAAAPSIDALVENLPGNVYRRVRRPDGAYLFEYLSYGLFRQFGIDQRKLLETKPVRFDWIHPDDRARFVTDLEMSAATLGVLDHRVRVVGEDGRIHWARGIARPTRRADGCVVWDGIVIDVTREVEAEAALRVAKEEADRAHRAAAAAVSAAFARLEEPLADLAALVVEADGVGPQGSGLAAALSAVHAALTAAAAAAPAPSGVKAPERPRRLTQRQTDVLTLMRAGHSNKVIAQRLGITPGTAKLHAASVLRAMGVRGRKELARLDG